MTPPPKNPPKPSVMLASALRNLGSVQGSTSRDIVNYINAEYDGPARNVNRDVKLALRRGVDEGILQRSKDGLYTCAVPDAGGAPQQAGCCPKRKKRSCKKRKRRCPMKRKKRCGKKRRPSCRRKKRKCCNRNDDNQGEGQEEEDDGAFDSLAVLKTTKRQRCGSSDRDAAGSKMRGTSKVRSEARVSSASSVATQDSVVDAKSHTGSMSGQSDGSGLSDDHGHGKNHS